MMHILSKLPNIGKAPTCSQPFPSLYFMQDIVYNSIICLFGMLGASTYTLTRVPLYLYTILVSCSRALRVSFLNSQAPKRINKPKEDGNLGLLECLGMAGNFWELCPFLGGSSYGY